MVLKLYLLLCLCSQVPLVFASSLISSISPPRRTSVGFIYLFLTSVYLFTYFLAALGLGCCVKAGPGCRERGLVSSCGGRASHRGARGAAWPLGMWALPGSGVQWVPGHWPLGFHLLGTRDAQLGFRRGFLTVPLQGFGFLVLNPSSLCLRFAL